MAISFPLYPLSINHLSTSKGHTKKKFVMCAKNGISLNPQIRFSHFPKKIKIFEDISAGVVCFRDENGEISCEGYDEGPRFHHQISISSSSSSSSSTPRDFEIIELLQRCWVDVGNENEFRNAEKGVEAGHKGF